MPAKALGEFHPFRSAEARERYLSRYDEAAASWPILSETTMVSTEHGETFVRVGGPSEAPPLVLLSGVWGTSLMWECVIEELSNHYRTYAVDNIVDIGRSVSCRPVKTTPDFMAWMDGLFDGLGLTSGVNVLGCSRGTWLAAEYALYAPARLGKSVWLSPPTVVVGPSPGSALGGPVSLAAWLTPSRATVGALMSWLMPDFKREDRAGFDQYVADTALGLRSFDTRFIGSYLGPRTFTDDELAGIDVPILYMAGGNEKMSSVKAAVSRLRNVAPQIETAVIPDVGHELPGLRTQEFNERVLSFLGSQ